MKKVFIVLLFILLGSALIVVSNTNKKVENSFAIVYENNKNIALPNLTNKTEITDGLYRLFNSNNITIDYNVYNGIYNINGTTTDVVSEIIINIQPNTTYALSYISHNGTITGGSMVLVMTSPVVTLITQNNQNVNKTHIFTTTNQTQLRIYTTENNTFNNYQFRLQLEKGSYATSYVVPKLVPIYQDNLSLEEKQKIGLGAFGGITKIIKTINDIIKPVGDFINGLLSWF